jgi:hypothetical protein
LTSAQAEGGTVFDNKESAVTESMQPANRTERIGGKIGAKNGSAPVGDQTVQWAFPFVLQQAFFANFLDEEKTNFHRQGLRFGPDTQKRTQGTGS